MKLLLLLVPTLFVVMSCTEGPESPRGFSLPKGDAEIGKQVFLKHQCLGCHSINGVEDSSLDKEISPTIQLGGEVGRVKTYADLVTSIINPSHKLVKGYPVDNISDNGQSKMTNFNDVMTVTELTHVVTYLQEQYEVVPRQYTHYNIYHIP